MKSLMKNYSIRFYPFVSGIISGYALDLSMKKTCASFVRRFTLSIKIFQSTLMIIISPNK